MNAAARNASRPRRVCVIPTWVRRRFCSSSAGLVPASASVSKRLQPVRSGNTLRVTVLADDYPKQSTDYFLQEAAATTARRSVRRGVVVPPVTTAVSRGTFRHRSERLRRVPHDGNVRRTGARRPAHPGSRHRRSGVVVALPPSWRGRQHHSSCLAVCVQKRSATRAGWWRSPWRSTERTEHQTSATTPRSEAKCIVRKTSSIIIESFLAKTSDPMSRRTAGLTIDMENVALHLETFSFALFGQKPCLYRGRYRNENAIFHDDRTGNNRPAARLIANEAARLQIILQTKLS